MRRFLILVFSLSQIFQQTTASGFLELSFKSDFNLNAFVNISSSNPPSFLLIPFQTSPNHTETLPKIPIGFENEEYHLTVFVFNLDKPDIDNSTITASFAPRRGILSPLTVMFPFTGVKINTHCDDKWFGEKCDQFCCSETAKRVGKVCNIHGMLGCPKGKRGVNCEQTFSRKWCKKCRNSGECVSSFGKNLSEKVQCECPIGFAGALCEKELAPIELLSVYGVDPSKFQIGTAKMLYESVVDNEFVEVDRPHSSHVLHNLRINDA